MFPTDGNQASLLETLLLTVPCLNKFSRVRQQLERFLVSGFFGSAVRVIVTC